MLIKTNNGNTKYAFHAKELSNEIIIACKTSGMISTINTTSLPIYLEFQHPIASADNANKVISAFIKSKDWSKAEPQLIAGCILSLLSVKGKTTNYPMSSATEANMLLQSAGKDLLRELAEIIILRWDSEATWIRVPKLSFDLTAYTKPAKSMSDVISGYARIIRKALSLDELPPEETAEVYKAFKENSLKANKDKSKSTEWLESMMNAKIANIKAETFDRQMVLAKVYLKNIADSMPKDVVSNCNKILANISFMPAKQRDNMAATIRLLFIGNSKQEMANNLAFIIENAHIDILEEDIIGAMDSELPKERSEKIKTIAEIMAEKWGTK